MIIQYQQRTFLHPARHGWLDRLASMMERLYCKEDRQVIRLKVLEVLREVVTSSMVLGTRYDVLVTNYWRLTTIH